jgi:hypothetical protein
MKSFKKFMLNEEEGDFSEIDEYYDDFFTVVGSLLDSLDSDKVTTDTIDLVDDLIDKIIDVILSLENDDLSGEAEEYFLDIVDMLGLDDEDDSDDNIEDDLDENISTLKIKPRKVKAGRMRSKASKIRGKKKIKYLKKLRDKRKLYKKSASLKNKTKRKMMRYKKTSKAKMAKRKYKNAHR